MTFSALATGRVLPLGFYHSPDGRKLRRYMPRTGRVGHVVNHHIVGGIAALEGGLLNTSRTLSVNYGVASDGTIHGCVAEEFKANTSSHVIDHSAVTLEIANELPLTSDYRMTDVTWHAAARLNADVARRYGFVPSASTIRFHQQYYATACPGDFMWSRRAEFIALVKRYYDGLEPEPVETPAAEPEPIPEEDGMFAPSLYINKTSEGMRDLGVGIYDDGRVEALTRQQWEAWQMLGSPKPIQVRVDGHWSFLMNSAARARAAGALPAPVVPEKIAKAIVEELGKGTSAAQITAALAGA